MKIFISWSGAKSRVVAETLRQELPTLINEAGIFVSSEDIDKGSAWFPAIAKELEDSAFGIICLTRDNLASSWIHFEAGALAARFSQAKVAPLLIELEKAEVPPPLSQLQLTQFTRDDFFRLISSINKHRKKPLQEEPLRKCFDRCWPALESQVAKLIKEHSSVSPAPTRSERDILEEILGVVRSIQNTDAMRSFEDQVNSVFPSGITPPGFSGYSPLPDYVGKNSLHINTEPAGISATLKGPLDY